jgi:WD40 repeat protein
MLVAVTAFLISATPRPCEAVEVGQIVEVRVETQALRGKQSAVTVPEGDRFEVREAQNGWLLGQFVVEGQKVLGWVRAKDVRATDQTTTTDVGRYQESAQELAQRKPELQSLGTSLAHAVSADSSLLAMVEKASPTQIDLIDLSAGDVKWQVAIPEGETVRAVQISADRQRLCALTNEHVRLWKLDEQPTEVFTAKRRDSPGGPGVTILIRGGRTAVIGHGEHDEATIWNEAGEEVVSFETWESEPLRCFLGPTGRTLVLVYGRGVQCWEEGSNPPKVIEGATILHAAASGDREHLALHTNDGVLLWQLEPLRVSDNLRASNIVDVAIPSDSSTMFTPRQEGQQIEVSRIGHDGKISHSKVLNAFRDLPVATISSGKKIAYVSENYDRNGTILVTATDDGTWQVLRLFRLTGDSAIEKPSSILLSENARTVAASWLNGRVAVWDVASNHVLWHTTFPDLAEIWLHPSGNNVLAHRQSGELVLSRPRDWAVAGTKLTFGTDEPGWRRNYTELKQLHFSRDGRQLVAVTSAHEKSVAFYNTERGTIRHANGFKANTVQFTASGDKLYMIGSYRAALCESLSGDFRPVVAGRIGSTWTPGERPVHGRLTINRKTAKVMFDPATGMAINRFATTEVNTSGLHAVSTDGSLMAFIGSNLHRHGYGIEVIDVATGKSIAAFPLEIDSYVGAKFTANSGHVLIATNDRVIKVDYRKREVTKLLAMESHAVFSFPSGGSVAAAAILGSARELGYSGNETRTVDPIRAMDASENGWIFTGHASGSVAVWDGATGERVQILANPPEPIEVLAVSEDGRWLACGPDEGGVAYLLDLRRRLPDRDAAPAAESPSVEQSTELTLSF